MALRPDDPRNKLRQRLAEERAEQEPELTEVPEEEWVDLAKHRFLHDPEGDVEELEENLEAIFDGRPYESFD